MTAKPSAVNSASAQDTTDSSFSSGVGDNLQQRCHTIESGLNDLRTVLKTLTTTCVILERSAEKLGSDMMEIRNILARNHSPRRGQDISARRAEGGGSTVAARVNDPSLSKLGRPVPRSSNIPADTINAIAGPSGVTNATRTSPTTKQPGAQPGAYITPVGRMSVSSVVPPTEAPLPASPSSSQPDTPARPIVPSSGGKKTVTLGATGNAQIKRKEDDLMNGVSTPVLLRTLPPRRARKQGLGFPKPVPPGVSSSEIEPRIIYPRAQKFDAPDTSSHLPDNNASNSSHETLVSTYTFQHNAPKQVHFEKEFIDILAPISEVRTLVEPQAANTESLPEPAPRMELRIRIRNPTKNAPGRIENISGMRVRIPKAVLDKMPSSVASSVPFRMLAAPASTPISIPSSQVSGSPKMATTSVPVPSSETTLSSTVPKAKRPVGRPRKRRKTASISKKVKQEDIETSLTTDGSLLQMGSEPEAGAREPFNASIYTTPNEREEKPVFEFTSLTKALEKCKDAFSNYLVAASRESMTPASSTDAPRSSKRTPAQKRLASSSVPSAATFSPKIETQDFPMYPSTLSVSAPPLASSSNASTHSAALPAPLISPPFLVPSNAPPTNPEPPGTSLVETTPRSRRQRGARLAELDREAEQRMRVSREKRDKTRWDPGSGRRVVVPAGVTDNECQSGFIASAEGLVRSVASRGRGTGGGRPLSRGLTQGAGSGSKLKETNMSPIRAGVIVKEEEEEEEW